MGKDNFEGQMDFLGLLTEYEDSQGARVIIREPRKRKAKPNLVFEDLDQMELDFVSEPETEGLKEEPKTEAVKEEPKPEVVKEEPKPEAVKEEPEVLEVEEEPKVKKSKRVAVKEKSIESKHPFKACVNCWCSTCRHNERLEGVPREMCGKKMPCPACKGCIEEDNPSICEIGNAKEGCRTRALEEGIVTNEEYTE